MRMRPHSIGQKLQREAIQINSTKKVITVKFGSEPEATKASMDLDTWSELWHHPRVVYLGL